MRSQILIAAAVAGLAAAPIALAQYGSPSTPGAPGSSGMDKPPPGTSSRGSTAGSTAGATSGSPSGSPQASLSMRDFQSLDKNKDGFLSKDEVRGNANLSSQFDRLDANRDGKLSQSELNVSTASTTRSGGNTGPDSTISQNPQTRGRPPGSGDFPPGN
jgi:EF hand domain-containing protein